MDEKLLLEILQRDARISDADLAKMLSVSEAEIKKKIEELKKHGIIKAFTAYVDWEKKGEEHITAYIYVKVAPQERIGFDRLGEELAANPKVEEVCVSSGEYDLTVKIKAKDIRDVSNFVTETLAPKRGVMGTSTHFVMKKFKENGVVLADAAKEKKLVISA
jgi:DNA-binding Lrp family transcriptional regulator